MLDYGYAILEMQCRKALNRMGLETTVGVLHEARQTKSFLVYDMMEPWKWLVETTVIQCLENKESKRRDFFRTDDYVLRLKPEVTKRLLERLGTF